MVEYISPILGKISEDIYNHVVTFKATGYHSYFNVMKRDFGFGKLRSGILWLETEFNEPREFVGSELNLYLLSKGFSTSVSSSLIKLLASNQTLIEDLVEKGNILNDVVYGLDLSSRLKFLGLETRVVTTSFAFESTFVVYPIMEISLPPEEEEIIIPEVVYRSQATFTYSSRRQGTKVEVRIWYQSYNPIEEGELIDKWNEANENAVNLTNEPLLDSMQPEGGDIQPGFELNHEISEGEVEGSIDTWYGKLVINRGAKTYIYDIL